jgi:hypothetical protein
MTMRYRVEEWVDDESRHSGRNLYTVYKLSRDGTEHRILETRDCDEVDNVVDGEECDWPQ